MKPPVSGSIKGKTPIKTSKKAKQSDLSPGNTTEMQPLRESSGCSDQSASYSSGIFCRCEMLFLAYCLTIGSKLVH